MFGSTWSGQVLGMGKQQGLGAEPVRYPGGVALLVMQIVHPEGLWEPTMGLLMVSLDGDRSLHRF